MGLAIADRLARGGLRVTLLERNRCGRGASWAAAGLLKPSSPNRTGPMQDLHRSSLAAYKAFCADLLERTGIDPQFARHGSIEVLFEDQRFRMAASEERAGLDQPMPDGSVTWEMLTVEEARSVEPSLGQEGMGAIFCRSAAQVRTPRLLQALAHGCRNAGVQIIEGAAVEALLVEGERLGGVQTRAGRYEAPAVILAAGAWSNQVDDRLAQLMPAKPVRGQSLLLDGSGLATPNWGLVIECRGCYVLPRADGLVVVGATVEPGVGFDERTTEEGIGGLIAKAVSMVPALADAPLVKSWAGLRSCAPDARPYIGPVSGIDGLIAATTHYRTGITMAPITASAVADLIINGQTKEDISWCKPGRSFERKRSS